MGVLLSFALIIFHVLLANGQNTYCDISGVCGPNGNCDLNTSPACVCLNGFTAKSPSGWDSMVYTQGCVRNKPLNCSTDGFVKYSVFKEPNGTYWSSQSLTDQDCKGRCLRNCSCVAYTTGSGCKLWSGNLFNVRVIAEGGQDLYIRMAASELGVRYFPFSSLYQVIMLVYC